MKLDNSKIIAIVLRKGLKINFLIKHSGYSRKSYYDYVHNRIDAPEDFINNLARTMNVGVSNICMSGV